MRGGLALIDRGGGRLSESLRVHLALFEKVQGCSRVKILNCDGGNKDDENVVLRGESPFSASRCL